MTVAVSGLTRTDQASEIDDLLGRATRADHRPPLSEHKMMELHRGVDQGLGLQARIDQDLVGLAQLAVGRGLWGLEVVVDPGWRGDGQIRGLLVAAAIELAWKHQALPVHYWVSEPSTLDDAEARRLGFVADRDLLQMTVHLPLDEEPRLPPASTLRPFRVGHDEEPWLAVNNRAFADHPEQGGWTLETLRERETEPWFRPDGFLVLEIDGQMVGSCWTKVHAATTPAMGEIYVISVDPSAHGQGLGRALTVAGLSWLADQGLSVGMLYTTASNTTAVGLYRALGFDVTHTDRAYVLTPTSRPTI